MISTSVMTGNAKTRRELVNLFYNAGISYLLGYDWKNVFRKERVSSVGTKKRFCEFWLAKTDAEMLKAVDVFLETV